MAWLNRDYSSVYSQRSTEHVAVPRTLWRCSPLLAQVSEQCWPWSDVVYSSRCPRSLLSPPLLDLL